MPLFAHVIYASMMRRERRRSACVTSGGAGSPAISHLETGRRGETLAYWYLRSQGYTMVARNLRLRPGAGELDMVGWDRSILAFVEVKTRSSLEAGLPGEAVGDRQRRRIAAAAALYVRRLNRKEVNYRFDVVSAVWTANRGFDLSLTKDAFRPERMA